MVNSNTIEPPNRILVTFSPYKMHSRKSPPPSNAMKVNWSREISICLALKSIITCSVNSMRMISGNTRKSWRDFCKNKVSSRCSLNRKL